MGKNSASRHTVSSSPMPAPACRLARGAPSRTARSATPHMAMALIDIPTRTTAVGQQNRLIGPPEKVAFVHRDAYVYDLVQTRQIPECGRIDNLATRCVNLYLAGDGSDPELVTRQPTVHLSSTAGRIHTGRNRC